MVASRSGRWMALTAFGVVVLATAVTLACASGPTPAPKASRAARESAETERLTDVRVESGERGSVVTLLGLTDPVYTAFLHSEPRALVLDLASVEIATTNDLVMVYDGLVENVTVSTYGGSACSLAFSSKSRNCRCAFFLFGATSVNQMSVSTASTWQKNGRILLKRWCRQCWSSLAVSGVTSHSLGFGHARHVATCRRTSLIIDVGSYCCSSVESPLP